MHDMYVSSTTMITPVFAGSVGTEKATEVLHYYNVIVTAVT